MDAAAFSGRRGRKVQRLWSTPGAIRSACDEAQTDRRYSPQVANRMSLCGSSGNANRRAAIRSPGAPQGRRGQPGPSQSEAPLPRCPTTRHPAHAPVPAPAARRRARRPDPPSADERSLTLTLSHGTPSGISSSDARYRTSAGPRRSAGPGAESTRRSARATAVSGGLALAAGSRTDGGDMVCGAVSVHLCPPCFGRNQTAAMTWLAQ